VTGFGVRLREAIAATGALCAGVDPSPALLGAWGLDDDERGLEAFGLRCTEAFAGVLPAVKLQVAFFERRGASGYRALERVIAAAHDAGLLVIADAKRGDVDVTMAAYADAWMGAGSPLAVDAVTATPYLGLGSLDPLLDAAAAEGRGVFVVVRSSNPQGSFVQESVSAAGTAVADALLSDLAARNAEGPGPVGPFGAVIGATASAGAFDLGQLRGPILAPGLGAQGAGPAEVAALFAGCPPGSVLPSASRSLLAHGPDPGALRDAAHSAREELDSALSRAGS